jgi:signal transduction histidine kinase
LIPNEESGLLFFNLLYNAYKYGKPASTVEISFSRGTGGYSISFATTSCNIYPDEVDDITLIGVRGRRAQIYTGTGEGIGLAVVKIIVVAYGGRLIIEPGVPDAAGEGFALNRFALEFPQALIRANPAP